MSFACTVYQMRLFRDEREQWELDSTVSKANSQQAFGRNVIL